MRLHHFHNLPLKPALPNKCNLSLPAPGWCGSWWARDGFHLPGRSQVQPHHWQSIKGSWSFGLYGKVKRNVNWIHCWYFRLWQNAGRVKSWKCITMGENQWKSMCNMSILKTSIVWNICMRKKWWSRLKFPSVAKNNLSKMRTFTFCATFVLHFLFCDYIQKDCSIITVPIQKIISPLSINDLPAWAKYFVSLPRHLRLGTFFTSYSTFFNWNKSAISQGFLLSFCAVDLQRVTYRTALSYLLYSTTVSPSSFAWDREPLVLRQSAHYYQRTRSDLKRVSGVVVKTDGRRQVFYLGQHWRPCFHLRF